MALKIKNTSHLIHELKPTILMVIAETIMGVNNVLYKLAVNDGFDLRILVTYRFLFAAAFLIPVALFVERNKRPKLTWTVIWQSLLAAFIGGSLLQNLFVLSLALTSATFATATSNLLTAITFILAIFLRLEKLNWDKASGKAKVMGTLLSLAGGMVLTLYKGPNIIRWNVHINLVNHGDHHSGVVAGTHSNMIPGACSALGTVLCNALWMNLQAKIAEHYPCPYSSTALMVTMTSIQCTLFSLCVQRDWSRWKLGWNIRLLTAAYAGVMTTGVMFTLFAWCVRMRGPLFVSAFNPLMVVIVALAGPLVLNETLHLGSMIGGITIICGLYVLLWGKDKEIKGTMQSPETSSNDSTRPVKIALATSSLGASENHGVITLHHASVAAANADEEPDEIRTVEDRVN
ncbi:Nodulin MtN21 /EamA-like transporter family protein [Heracleum sosnowskyi]|uniref:WAT1-related protein n=1 Tax=Heracleum sosnowskyi TaxID=360622 RepID=A0AAD8NC59_9APIA|nr:Nodulin MtN21 /EamA-like transporter family protein [Heracleum sosnowskyi]